ncbi:MAG: DUF2442 domain-containing protein [Rhodoferax sp.]|uniref:DUF2442 domain-containing protein n=1 Tax=Rhodoferax sp. TaxID=50421 RepID=UPI002613F6F1|nr:DUF2442 domain-containing protein [Rhodoferax sp.]MDD2880718.1 DUF2442 domain-containing protein [Rhodoferax sp.]
MFKVQPKAMAIVCSDDELRVSLTDGRTLSVPLAWFPRLAHATHTERADYEILGDGEGIHWPQVDEDISVVGLLAGQPSVEVKAAFA